MTSRPDRTYIDYLRDMLDAAQSAQAFVLGMTVEDFVADKRTHRIQNQASRAFGPTPSGIAIPDIAVGGGSICIKHMP